MNPRSSALRILVVSVVSPLLIAVAALVITLITAIHSPASVAVHFGGDGAPNGYGSPFTYPILIAVVCIPIVVILGGAVVLVSHRRPFTIMLKTLGSAGLWVGTLLAIILTASSVEAQAGSALQPALWFPVAVGGAALLVVGGWFVLPPRVRVPIYTPTPIPALPLRLDERATWLRSASASAALIWAFVGICLAVAAVSAIVVVNSGGRIWEVSLIPVILLFLTLGTFAWHIRIDARGVDIRSVVGVPRFHVALADIVAADARNVDAFSEFGGWGLRFGLNGRVGIILRSGEALEVKRKKGLSIVVTVDDAASAAALVNGLVAQQSPAVP